VRNNVPFDVAFSLDETKRAAFAIVFSEFEGATFDWETFRFEART
jgi:hypothetical protein